MGNDLDGWEKIAQEGNAGLFRKGKTCVLAFAGTSSDADVMKDLSVDTRPFCAKDSGPDDTGWQVHEGFSEKANEFLRGRRVDEFNHFLGNKRKCKTVVLTGHSLGGAEASMIAA